MPTSRRRAPFFPPRLLVRLSLLALALACSSQDQVTDAPVAVASVSIEGLPGSPLLAGQSVQLKAVPLSAQGDRLTARASGAAWQTSDANVATINSAGLLTGVLGGQVTVSVNVAGAQGSSSATINNPAPQVISLSPPGADPGDSALTLTVTGAGFVKTSSVQWNGQSRATTYVGPTQLTVAVSAAELASQGTASVTVVNPPPGGGSAPGAATFSVRPPGLTQIAASDHTCALTPSGQAWCWGSNSNGQLGDGTTTNRSTPVAVQGGPAFSSIAVGIAHTCGLSTGGQVFCWGANASGQLGNGSTQDSPTPVAATAAGYKQVAAGRQHTCALRNDGAAFCWGANESGELGTGAAGASPVTTPTQVQSAVRFRQLSAGYAHTCGVGGDRQVYCWGQNVYGQLGNGSIDQGNTAPVTTPAAVQGGRSFRRVSAGWNHTCALTSAGDMYCWGDNGYGELGTGSAGANQGTPVRASASGFVSLSAGSGFTCGIQGNGDVLCWGNNNLGRAGGSNADLNYASAQKVASAAVSVAAGDGHACAIDASGAVSCWGFMGREGRLGQGSLAFRLRPVQSAALSGMTAIAPGDRHTCGLTSAGQALCWGYNGGGQLGIGQTPSYTATPQAVSGGRTYTQLSVGVTHSCAVTASRQAYCWGDNIYGAVGDGTNTARSQPTLLPGSFDRIATGGYHTCGLLTGGQVQCWGYNNEGEVGNGTTGGPVPSPTPVQGNPAITSFGYSTVLRTCGLTASGQAVCWGSNFSGALGNGGTSSSGVPVALQFSTPFQSLAEAATMTCGLTAAGQMYCWGAGWFGNGSFQSSNVPVPAGNGMTFKQISAGWEHVCGLTPTGQAYCWGSNYNGPLGTGDMQPSAVPVAFAPNQTFQSIVASDWSTCGLTVAGTTYCAGDDTWGQMGDGNLGFSTTPQRIAGSAAFSTRTDALPCAGRGCVAASSSRRSAPAPAFRPAGRAP